MYPIYAWDYTTICDRLDSLLSYKLYPEAVIASYLTIEKSIKRVIMSEMTKQRLGFVTHNKKVKETTKLVNKEERDKILHKLIDWDLIKRVWDLTMQNNNICKATGLYPLDKIIDDIMSSPNSWAALKGVKKHRLTYNALGLHSDMPYGMALLRHKLVHGVHFPIDEVVEVYAQWGVALAKKLLCPTNGLVKYTGFDPGKRAFAFRKRKSDRVQE